MRRTPSGHRNPGSLCMVFLTVVALPLLSGCGSGVSPTQFAARANTACAHSAARIAALRPPDTPEDAIRYAIELFEQKDRLLIELTEADLPSDEAAALRSRWLRPATRDLDRARVILRQVRTAARSGRSDRLAAALDTLRRAGSAGVDGEMLSRYGLTDCRALFGGSAGSSGSAAPTG